MSASQDRYQQPYQGDNDDDSDDANPDTGFEDASDSFAASQDGSDDRKQ